MYYAFSAVEVINGFDELTAVMSGKIVQIFFLVLELVEQGDLFSFIKVKNKAGGFSE